MKTVGQFQALLGNRDQHIGADRGPDLCLDGVLAGAKEGLDSKVLLDPFEEQLDLPPLSIEVGNHSGLERKIVGQKSDPFALVVFDDDPTQSVGIVFAGVVNGQDADLVADDVGRMAVDRFGVAALELCVRLGSGDKECAALVDDIKPGKVQVPPIQQVVRARLYGEMVQCVDLVHLPVADVDKRWNRASEIEQRMQLYGRLVLAKRCPRIHRQTKVDGRRIEGINRRVQIDSQRFVGVKRSSDTNKVLRKVGIYLPRSLGIRIGQRVARHRVATQAHVIKPTHMRSQIQFDIAQRFPIRQLRKHRHQKLVEARKVFDLAVARVAIDTTLEGCLWQQRGQLRENEFALVHGSPLHSNTKDHKSWCRRSNRHQTKSPENQYISSTYGVLMFQRWDSTDVTFLVHV